MTPKRIVGGPSKWDLILALFEGAIRHRTAVFQVEGDKPGGIGLREIVLISLEREDGSGENWNFRGWRTTSERKVHGFYSTRTRTGSITEGD